MAGTPSLVSIPMFSSDITELEVKAVVAALKNGLRPSGIECLRFEELFRLTFNSKYAISVNSGSAALHLCIRAAGVGPGDIIITSPVSDISTAEAILYENAIPLFVDIDNCSGLMDLEYLKEVIHDVSTSSKLSRRWLPRRGAEHVHSLKVVLPVDVFGLPLDIGPLVNSAAGKTVVVIEDSRQALGTINNDHYAGTQANFGVFSFQPGNPISTGGGGMIVTENEGSAHLLRTLRNEGCDPMHQNRIYTKLGFNYHMNEMIAALGRTQLLRLDSILAARHKVAQWYNLRLSESQALEIPPAITGEARQSWPAYVVKLDPSLSRQKIIEELAIQGIPSTSYLLAVHLQPFMVERFGYRNGDFPEAELMARRMLALPFSSVMTEKQVDTVCNSLRQIL